MKLASASFAAICLTQSVQGIAIRHDLAPETEIISHGSSFEYQGKPMRYHQIYKGVWTGVPYYEWDDAVHIRCDKELDIPSTSSWEVDLAMFDTTPWDKRGLEKRDLEDVCSFAVTCAIAVGNFITSTVPNAGVSTAYALSNVWQQGYNAVIAATPNQGTVFELLRHPLTVPIAITVASVPVWVTFVTSLKNGQTPISSCSTEGSETDVIASALAKAVVANPNAQCLQVAITLPNGTEGTLSICAGPPTGEGGCGAPPISGLDTSGRK